jgi:hypothetical protein
MPTTRNLAILLFEDVKVLDPESLCDPLWTVLQCPTPHSRVPGLFSSIYAG